MSLSYPVKISDVIIAVTPMHALLAALVATHPDRDALLAIYNDASAQLQKALRATLPEAVFSDLKEKFDEMRFVVGLPSSAGPN